MSRDRAAEVGAAIRAATGGGGVTLSGAGTADRAIEGRFTGRSATWLPFHAAVAELAADGDTLLVGLGGDPRPETVRIAATAAGAAVGADGDVRAEPPAAEPDLVRAWADGLVSGIGPDRKAGLVGLTGPVAEEGVVAAQAVHLARALTNAPANLLTPARAAEWAVDIAAATGATSVVLDQDELRDQGFGALTAIGGGSVNGPRMVRLEYRGERPGPSVTLVGKGVTFDSGGLSAKSPDAMQGMRFDMAGAAAALAVLAVAARLGLPGIVRAVLPFAENLPGPGGARPGDVVTACNGTQIQIMDTDFEGRVILADALSLAVRDEPDLIVDLATLTYQAEIALGPEIGALLSPHDGAADAVLAAARSAGEPMWRLPFATRYLDQVRTSFGVRNHPLRPSGRAITAALFLGEFVPRSTPWAHIDMAGPAWTGDTSGDGATGYGVRTLLRLLGGQIAW